MSDIHSVVLDLQSFVNESDKQVPLTGVHSGSIAGWRWDRRRVTSAGLPSTRYETYVGGHSVGLLDGTQLKHWRSGVVDGFEYLGLVHHQEAGDLTWTPQYKTGGFTVHWDHRFLYSDYSYSANAVFTDGEERTVLPLRNDTVYGTISCAIYKRDSSRLILSVEEYEVVDDFTGKIQSEVRADPGSMPSVDWSLVEDRKREAVVHDGSLYLNQLAKIEVGEDTVLSGVITGSWENKGEALREGRSLFLNYFPVNPGSVKLVNISASGAITTWTEQDSLNFSTDSDLHFSVNHDLGVIQTGGFKAGNLVLSSVVTEYDTEITVLPSESFEQYPDSGVVVVGGEQIMYTSKGHYSFLGCLRGYNSTVAALHARASAVEDIQHGASGSGTWYVRYTAVPRVEYEVSETSTRSANSDTGWLDVRADVNPKSNNIAQLVSQDIDLAEVVLTTSTALIGGNLYGPVYYGTDTSKLTATGYDSAGNPVEDVPLTIYIKSGTGYLNGASSSYTADSNSLGRAFCFYNSPIDQDTIDYQVESVTHVGADTHMVVNFTAAPIPQDVWVFQILKHDPVVGTVGDRSTAFDGGAASEPYGLGYIDVWMRRTEDYDGGTLRLLDSSSVTRNFTIRSSFEMHDVNDEPYTRFYVQESVDPAWISSSSVWLFQPDAVEWDSGFRRGARVILYEWSTDSQHPVTGAEGAYAPVHPDEIVGNTLIFKGRQLPVPAPGDAASNLGGYVVVAAAETRFAAYGRDPFTGRLINSNEIRLRMALPHTLTGVDRSGLLPIPYGWTLITEEFNIGAGIGGASFITVNPAATGINQFSITGVI